MTVHRLALLVLAMLGTGACHAAGATLEAGASRTDITPPSGFPMWGYASRKDQPSNGVRDPLQARALVLAGGDDRLAIVSLDLGRAPPRAIVQSLRTRLKAAVGIEHFFLVASHTHHGPVLELDDWPTGKPYLRQLEQKLFDLVVAAARTRQPACLGVAAKELPLNRNRHSRRPEPPADRELVVMRVESANGKVLAHAVNFAAHATTLDARDRRWSADWPGALAAAVEKETGAPCLFLQGAAGDLSANLRHDETPEAYGQAVGKEALSLSHGLRCQPLPSGSLQIAEEDFTFTSRLDLGNPFIHASLALAFFPSLIAFYEREYRLGVRPHLTVALLDGRWGFVGVSGEFFCSHALSLKRRARVEHLFFLGYCNDYQQYFPTIEAFAEGGYGTEPYLAPAEVGAGERMMDRALIQLYQMRGRLK